VEDVVSKDVDGEPAPRAESQPAPRAESRPEREPLPTELDGLPPLPEEYWTALRGGLDALFGDDAGAGEAAGRGSERGAGRGADTGAGPGDEAIPEARLETIADHVRLLLAWNEAINLSGIRAPAAIALQHVVDSLTALPILRRSGVEDFIDLGSGGGYPGLPLAIALPARRALLVESVGKKARFLAAVIDATGLRGRVAVAATRAETLAADPHHRGQWGAVTARAVGDMGELAELSLPLLRVGGLFVAWKRRPAEDELAAADGAIHQLHGRLIRLETVTVPGLEDNVLVVVEKIGDTPAQFPRDPAVRRRRPL
jgi:16S rRNA (guanine527-N7)-methyltransferase